MIPDDSLFGATDFTASHFDTIPSDNMPSLIDTISPVPQLSLKQSSPIVMLAMVAIFAVAAIWFFKVLSK